MQLVKPKTIIFLNWTKTQAFQYKWISNKHTRRINKPRDTSKDCKLITSRSRVIDAVAAVLVSKLLSNQLCGDGLKHQLSMSSMLALIDRQFDFRSFF